MAFKDPDSRGCLKCVEKNLFQQETGGMICSDGPCVPACPRSYYALFLYLLVYTKNGFFSSREIWDLKIKFSYPDL